MNEKPLLSIAELMKIISEAMAKSGMTCEDYAKNVRRAWKMFRKLNKRREKDESNL